MGGSKRCLRRRASPSRAQAQPRAGCAWTRLPLGRRWRAWRPRGSTLRRSGSSPPGSSEPQPCPLAPPTPCGSSCRPLSAQLRRPRLRASRARLRYWRRPAPLTEASASSPSLTGARRAWRVSVAQATSAPTPKPSPPPLRTSPSQQAGRGSRCPCRRRSNFWPRRFSAQIRSGFCARRTEARR